MKPATLFVFVGQLALAMATANNTSVDETTACVTTTIFTTTTVTVTGHPGVSSSPASPLPPTKSPSTSYVESKSSWLSSVPEPVKPTSAPYGPPHSSVNITTIKLSLSVTLTSEIAPYPTTNGTTSATGSVTAPPSSGTSVTTGTSSATPPQFTSGQGKAAVNGLAMALVIVGGAFLSL